MSLEETVLDRISPNPDHRRFVDGVVSNLVKTVESDIRRRGLALEVRLVGSVAKDTYLRNPDIDLFIMFPTATTRKDLERVGLEIGRSVLGGEERYAEHPYVHGEFGGLEVDLVPCYKIASPLGLKSAVDRTPFHTEYVKGHVSEKQKAEIRLLKQFTKGIGVYGAEAKTQGFSGYLIELLILRYGNFRMVLKEASKWRYGQMLYLAEHSKEKIDSPLVFYDPVDPKRNVGSALSLDSFSLFVHACGEYLRKEDIRFFFPEAVKALGMRAIKNEIRSHGTRVIVIEFKRPKIIDDDLYPQARKTLEGLKALLETNDFVVIDRTFHIGDTVRFVLELQSDVLPKRMRHQGPPVWIDNAEEFLAKWNGRGIRRPFIDKGRWVVIAEREYTRAADIIRGRVGSMALGSDFRGKKGFKVVEHEAVLTRDFKEALTKLLDKRRPWERRMK
ncbi:MAG: CCA tRNA nucleotidyltransferase [Methanomassiliicoccales archaeon]|nr:CCA tRNA nucleotidyltransferase [Methanomassiliicoccales archaeon]